MTACTPQHTLLTESEVARILRVPVGTVRWWRQQRRLAFVKVGRHVRIRAVEVERFLDAQDVPSLNAWNPSAGSAGSTTARRHRTS